MCRMYSDFAFCCRYIGIANLHLANEYTGGADLVIRDELFGEFPLAFCDVAVPTTADGIRVVVRDGSLKGHHSMALFRVRNCHCASV